MISRIRQPLSTYASSIPTTGSTVLRVDLASDLSRLTDGKLNLAVAKTTSQWIGRCSNCVWPRRYQQTTTQSFAAEADATVRGGASASANFGTATTLSVKEDASADNDRRSLLRWDLSGVSNRVFTPKCG